MAQDRFIYWNKRKPENAGEIANILSRYLGNAATDFDFEGKNGQDVWTISLPGIGKNPVDNSLVGECYNHERWFEVWLTNKHMDVITREQDPFVNAIADGFAALIARWYEAKRGE